MGALGGAQRNESAALTSFIKAVGTGPVTSSPPALSPAPLKPIPLFMFKSLCNFSFWDCNSHLPHGLIVVASDNPLSI